MERNEFGRAGLYLKEGRNKFFLSYKDLLWAKSEGNYIELHVSPDVKRVTRITMKDLNEQLPVGHFVRVHKTYIVNISYVTNISGNSLFIGQQQIPLGRAYKSQIKSVFEGLYKSKGSLSLKK